jgi:anti-anti-sigma regulatory factor
MAQILVLEASLDHQATGRLAAQLAAPAQATALDGGAVTHVGALFAQLLLQARAAAPDDRPVTLVNPSPACVEGLARLGIDAAGLA